MPPECETHRPPSHTGPPAGPCDQSSPAPRGSSPRGPGDQGGRPFLPARVSAGATEPRCCRRHRTSVPSEGSWACEGRGGTGQVTRPHQRPRGGHRAGLPCRPACRRAVPAEAEHTGAPGTAACGHHAWRARESPASGPRQRPARLPVTTRRPCRPGPRAPGKPAPKTADHPGQPLGFAHATRAPLLLLSPSAPRPGSMQPAGAARPSWPQTFPGQARSQPEQPPSETSRRGLQGAVTR